MARATGRDVASPPSSRTASARASSGTAAGCAAINRTPARRSADVAPNANDRTARRAIAAPASPRRRWSTRRSVRSSGSRSSGRDARASSEVGVSIANRARSAAARTPDTGSRASRASTSTARPLRPAPSPCAASMRSSGRLSSEAAASRTSTSARRPAEMTGRSRSRAPSDVFPLARRSAAPLSPASPDSSSSRAAWADVAGSGSSTETSAVRRPLLVGRRADQRGDPGGDRCVRGARGGRGRLVGRRPRGSGPEKGAPQRGVRRTRASSARRPPRAGPGWPRGSRRRSRSRARRDRLAARPARPRRARGRAPRGRRPRTRPRPCRGGRRGTPRGRPRARRPIRRSRARALPSRSGAGGCRRSRACRGPSARRSRAPGARAAARAPPAPRGGRGSRRRGARPPRPRAGSGPWSPCRVASVSARPRRAWSASASSTSGPLARASSAWTKASVGAERPRPGPTTIASARSNHGSSASRDAGPSAPRSSQGSGTVMVSGRNDAATSKTALGTASVTRPAPPRSAPRAASAGAPAMPGAPADDQHPPHGGLVRVDPARAQDRKGERGLGHRLHGSDPRCAAVQAAARRGPSRVGRREGSRREISPCLRRRSPCARPGRPPGS